MAATSVYEQSYPLPVACVRGRIGVVTVTYNSSEVLPEFFVSLDGQTHRDFVVYAVDNASTDDTLVQLGEWGDPRKVVISNTENLGVAAGNNQGVRAAIESGCEHILLLNNDVSFKQELFQQLLDGLKLHGCSMTTPLIYFSEPKDMIWCAGGYFQPWLGYRNLHYGEGQIDAGQFSEARAVTYAPTCCVLIRREVFSRIGLMDERYFVYSDDTDFMLRAMKAGLILYLLPTAKLWHKVNSLTGTDSPFSMRYGARNRAFFIAKHIGGGRAGVLHWFYYVYYLLRFLLGKDSLEAYRIKRNAWAEGKYLIAKTDKL